MLRSFATLVCSLFTALAGCDRRPPEVPVGELKFPAILLYGQTSGQVARDAEDLALIPVQRYMVLPEQMLVIDSNARVLEMRDIAGQHGGGWITLNPSGLMPVTFRLVPQGPGGMEQARTLLLACEFLGRRIDDDSIARIKERIRAARDMGAVFRAIDGTE